MSGSTRGGVAPAASCFRRGFTLPELMIASAITLMMAGGVLVTQIFGMRVFEATSSKMELSLEARSALGQMIDDVRSARKVQVGMQIRTTFIPVASGSANPRRGNAIVLTTGTNASEWVRYDVDYTTGNLRRSTNNTRFDILSSGITNIYAFQLEDFRGNVLTQAVSRSVVGVELGYNPGDLSSLRIGTNAYYQSYRLRAKVSHREVN